MRRSWRRTLVFACAMACGAAGAQNAAVTVNIDANANRHLISPNIYGVAFGNSTTLTDLNAPLNRNGGNSTSRYNWQFNADNRGQDWYFESLGDASSTAGERGDTFITMSKSVGAQSMITVPMIDWVAKLGANRSKLSSFSVGKYGAQTGTDWQWYPDAGNGVQQSTGQNITWNDPNDANTPNSATMQQSWVQHIVSQFGPASSGGLKYYILDNEHSIWHQTHRDVHSTGANMDEIKQKMIAYASAIKAVDPSALVFGPEEWGWSGYFYSGYDQQYGAAHNWCCFPDKQAHGNWDYLPWLLDQMRQYEASNGRRLLDVFSVHYYPQGGEFSDDTSSAMQLTRNKSTRSLWDPNYVDPTWINNKVMLIPRIKTWVSTYYPGLKTAITEYNWGAEGHINGATTQADIYGIFGRENLDFATRWTTPDPTTPTYKAMKMYRNYDGNHSTFGDTSVTASVPNPDTLSAFAGQRSSDGAMTVMVVSKVLSGTTPVTLNLANFSATGLAQAWQLTSANAITRLADATFTGSSFSTTVPAQSVTLFVLPTGSTSKATTTTGIATSLTPSTVGSSVTFTATVSGNAPTGSVNFLDGATSISGCAAVALAGSGNIRTATCSTSSLAAGTHSIVAIYGGDAGNTGSTSVALSQVVNSGSKVATTTAIATSLTPSTVGSSVTFTATVNGSAPTGSVNFKDGANSISGCSAVALAGSGNVRSAQCSTSALAAGAHSIVASYGGDAGNAASISAALSQVVNTVNPGQTTVWVDDAVPAGATTASDGGDAWSWISTNPAPYSGTLAHQSALASGEHQHYFYNATASLSVAVGDTLFAYIYLDPANPPSEVMLQWYDGSWEHRAYWGGNQIGWGSDGTVGRRSMGALPATGQWVRLAVPAAQVGLEGRTLTGMAFTLYGGRATWDYAGKTVVAGPTYQVSGTVTVNGAALSGVSFAATNGVSCSNSDATGSYACTVPQGWSGSVTPSLGGYTFTPASRSYSSVAANQTVQNYAATIGTGATSVWVEDAVPTGAAATSDGGDAWTWISANPAPYSGTLGHQSALASGEHQHYFTGATATLSVAVGDTLFAYVYLDPANPPSEVMLQWYDGSWEHRAYWGANQIGWGSDGTVGRRAMGALPATEQWVRLAVPAAQVGLEGRTLTGMAFTLYGGRATWDYAGK